MRQYLLLITSIPVLIAGCSPLTSTSSGPVPTPYPPGYLPTVVALTAQSMGDSATAEYLASIPTESPTFIPEPALSFTPGPTQTPTAIPGHELSRIQFLSPGPMSKVISPISLRINIKIGEGKSMQVDLYGEDGRLLSRIVKKVPTSNHGILQSVKIPFEIRATAEVGRITITTLDKEGRIQALNSVRMLLLSSGENEITPVGNPSEPVGVDSPLEDESVSGGVLTVRGDVWPFSRQPVIFELIGLEGRSLGLRILSIENTDPQIFETTLPYKVSESTPARLIIRQDDDRMPGLFYVYSQVVILEP